MSFWWLFHAIATIQSWIIFVTTVLYLGVAGVEGFREVLRAAGALAICFGTSGRRGDPTAPRAHCKHGGGNNDSGEESQSK